MAAAYCLPRSLVAAFNQATKQGGPLDPYTLQGMDSATRRAEIAKIIGDDNAKEVNALYEQTQLLKYKSGLQDWVNRVIAPQAIKDTIADKINNLDNKILNPANAQSFYEDLAEKKLGFQVTQQEAQKIYQAADAVRVTKNRWQATLGVDVTSKEFFQEVRGTKGAANLSPTVKNAVQARNAYGQSLQDLRDAINETSHKPDFVNSILSLEFAPKSLETGFLHLSAFGVQLWGSWTQPATWSGFIEQIKYFSNEENYTQLQNYIISHPYYQLAVKHRLGLTDIKGITSTREEEIQSGLIQNANSWVAEKLGKLTPSGEPLPINVFRASSRAFTGYLNYVRFNTFVRYVDSLKRINSDDVYEGSDLVQRAADIVNTLSGRANLGPAQFDSVAAPILNTVFFTARKGVADFNLANPYWYTKTIYQAYKTGNWALAQKAIGPLLGQIGAIYGTLWLVHSLHPFGWNADINPLSQSGGMLISPSGEKYNVSGSSRTMVRLAARLAMNKEINSDGKEVQLGGTGPGATTRMSLVMDELRNKLSPNAGFLTDWAIGKDAVGREFNIPLELRNRLEPIVMKNFIDYFNNNPDVSLSDLPMISSLAGMPVQSPLPLGERQGLTPWGENYNASLLHDPNQTDLVDSEMKKIGLKGKFPPQSINGVKLTDDEYQTYIKLAGTDAKQRLQTLMSSPNWESTPTAEKQFQVNTIIQTSQQTAQVALYFAKPELVGKFITKAQNPTGTVQ